MTPKKFEFNTNRHYGPDGQKITAFITGDRCYFRDHSRGIDASFASDGYALQRLTEREIGNVLMVVYDYGPAAGLSYESSATLNTLMKEAA